MATFTLYLPDAVLARVDELRGSTSRSGFIRAQLEGPVVASARSPEPGVDPVPSREPTGHYEGCGCLNCERAAGRL